MRVKKLLSSILVICMLLSTMGTFVFASSADPVAGEVSETEPVMVLAVGVAATVTNETTGKSESFDDIDDAFEALEAGDTITIAEGIHYLNKSDEWAPRNAEFSLPDNVTIIGEEGAVIQREPVFSAKGLTVKNVDFMGYAYVAMKIHGNAKFEDCTLIGPNGIYYSTVSEKLEFVNCTVKGDVYGLHVGEGTGDVIVSGCTISGWNTYGNTGIVKFTDTDFLDDSSYAFLGFYQDAVLEDCTFEPEMEIESIVGNTEIALNGCTVTDGSDISNILSANSAGSFVKNVAKIGDVYYTTLKAAIASAVEGDTIYLLGEINEGSIKLPATIKNLTIDGKNTAVVKDTVINASDGGYVDVQGFTVKNTTFENSRFVLGGQRSGDVLYKDIVFDNNKFVNIVNTASMAAVHMNLASEDNEYIENFTFTNNVIDGVTGSNNSGVLLKSITGDVVFEGNTVSNVAWNALQIATAKADAKLVVENNSFASSGSSVLNIAAAPSAILENNTVVNDSGRIGLWYPAEAKIGDVLYIDIQTAINNAKDGDTITILAGEYEGFDIPATKNNLTFVGETGSTGLSRSVENLVTIKTLDTGIESHNGGIFVGAENTTIKNINFTAGTVPGASSGWMSASVGNTNGDTGMSSSLKNLTIENCNFVGSGAYQAIWTNQGNVTVKNTTIKNYANGIDNYGIGADQKVVIENSKITDVHNAFHTGEAADGAQIVVTGTDIDSEVINIGGAVAVTVEESTIKNAAVTTYASSTFAVSESALYDTTYAVDANATGSITLDAVYANNVNALAANAKADNIAFNTYYPEAKDLGTGNTVAVPTATDAIYVKFENVTDADAEGEMTYNINLVATDTEIINRLNSADLTFAFDATEGDVAYEIIASNSEVAVNPVDNSKVRYEFHYNGKDGVTTDSANKITIGQVRFEGYGKFDFTVDAAVDTNTAHATTVADNIVDTFIPNGDATTVANGELVIDDTTITDVVIAVPDRNLAIKIDFPNAVENQVIAYQDMKVVISGGDLAEDITIDLGNDAVETALDIFGKEDAKFAAAMDNDGSYVINVTDALTLNNAYTITVSGAGYRTSRYTVTMTDDKQLNFWNNVKDEAQVVEVDKDSSIAKVTFLAGDIVKDNNINIYDLSAVVSYFGSVSTTENGYAKYDLNRDGVIDSKDVAYVLVSWNN